MITEKKFISFVLKILLIHMILIYDFGGGTILKIVPSPFFRRLQEALIFVQIIKHFSILFYENLISVVFVIR